ncbi:hypothetical protein ACQP2X_35620 [Actinoplanes sp. CA-131856]
MVSGRRGAADKALYRTVVAYPLSLWLAGEVVPGDRFLAVQLLRGRHQ